jgi:hypothetical protein
VSSADGVQPAAELTGRQVPYDRRRLGLTGVHRRLARSLFSLHHRIVAQRTPWAGGAGISR